MDRRFAAVIFDMNGVLVDDEPLHFAAFHEVFSEMGYQLTRDEYDTLCLGVADRDCFRAILPKIPGADLCDASVQHAVTVKGQAYMRLLEGSIPWMAGAQEVLRELSARGYRLGLATGAVRREAEMIVAELGPELFQVLLAAEDIGKGKPDPEAYLLAATRMALDPVQCLVVEDSVPGVEAAKAAGMVCAALTSSYPPSRLAEADIIINSLGELLGKIES